MTGLLDLELPFGLCGDRMVPVTSVERGRRKLRPQAYAAWRQEP